MRTCCSQLGSLLLASTASLLALSLGCNQLQSSATFGDGGAASNTSTAGSSSSAGSTLSTSGGGRDGAAGSNAVDAASLMRGPEPASGGANFPFPQNRQSSRCTYPGAYSNGDVQAAYAKWKADLVTSNNAGAYMRVQRTATDGIDGCRPLNSTVSEGIGYGMLVAVYMNDETLFDNLWLYEQQNLDQNGLMNWAPDGSGNGCGGAATDADEDMAFALVMADRQWGGQGMLKQSYEDSAIAQIQKIWDTEVFNWTWLRAGDGDWATNANINISYLAPAYYRVFAQVDPLTCPQGTSVMDASTPKWGDAGNQFCDRWWGVLDQAYASISDSLNSSNGNASNGLVPGWCNDQNAGSCPAAAGEPFNYQYDACRTPFRIGIDWCWNGETRAQSYLAQISSFFSGVGAANIVDGYGLNGMPQPATMLPDGGVPLAAPFVGPAAVGAMSSSTYQQFLNQAYGLVATDDLFVGGEYYSSSWTVMSLLMMTGSFLDYTQETPVQ